MERVGIVGPEWKLLRTAGQLELYALAPVADERRNRAGELTDLAAEMKRNLERELDAHPLAPLQVGEINEELLETLRGLGYL